MFTGYVDTMMKDFFSPSSVIVPVPFLLLATIRADILDEIPFAPG